MGEESPRRRGRDRGFRRFRRRLGLPHRQVDEQRDDDASQDEEGQGGDSRPAGAGQLTDKAEEEGAEDGGKLAGQAVKAEKLRIFSGRDEPAEDGAGQRLAPSLDEADEDGQQVEMKGRFHEVTQNNNNQINYQGSDRSEEHTSELQSRENLVCRLLLEKKTYTQ